MTTRKAAVRTVGGGIVIALVAVAIRAQAGAWDVAQGDSGATVPLWSTWLATLVGVLVATVIGPRPPRTDRTDERTPAGTERALRWQVAALTLAAVMFTALLLSFGVDEPVFTGGKLVLLVTLPLLVMRVWRVPYAARDDRVPTLRHHGGALAAVLAWGALTFLAPWSSSGTRPPVDAAPLELATILLVGFLVNAVIEEVFYRRWLQTRLEAVTGPWAAIVVTSVLFGAWHAALGTGGLVVDLAGALLHQGAIGVFLGFLWSRYRLMWPILVAHGALNAVPLML